MMVTIFNMPSLSLPRVNQDVKRLNRYPKTECVVTIVSTSMKGPLVLGSSNAIQRDVPWFRLIFVQPFAVPHV